MPVLDFFLKKIPNYSPEVLYTSEDESEEKYRQRQRVALHVCMITLYGENARLRMYIAILGITVAVMGYLLAVK